MTHRLLALPLSLLLLAGAAGAAEPAAGGDKKPAHAPLDLAKIEKATVTGVVTAVPGEGDKKKGFTLKDAAGDENEYRALYALPNVADLLKQIAALKVGDRITVEYTEHEGRRAITIAAAK